MIRPTHRLLPFIILAVAALVGACSQTGSPMAPSGSSGGTGATIVGQVAGSSTAERAQSTAAGLTVTVVGTSLATTVQGNGQFTLQNVPAGTVSLQFTGPGTNATVTLNGVTSGQQIQIVVSVSGSHASIESQHGSAAQGHGVELEGLISSIDLTGSALVVNGTTVSVPATAVIRHGSTPVRLADLQVGQRVHVKGTNQGSVIVASEILLQNENVSNASSSHKIELSGTLAASPAGTCPLVTFTLNGTVVVTSSATAFEDGACADLAAGSAVEVTGTSSASGLMASQISIETPESPESETTLKGTLAAAPTGTCPAVSFTLGTIAVSTTGTTVFAGGSCANLAAGTSVEARGTKTGSSLVATRVSIESHGSGDGGN